MIEEPIPEKLREFVSDVEDRGPFREGCAHDSALGVPIMSKLRELLPLTD